jgi:hypothetical protein
MPTSRRATGLSQLIDRRLTPECYTPQWPLSIKQRISISVNWRLVVAEICQVASEIQREKPNYNREPKMRTPN